jgi:hypothetical protein
MIAPYVAQRLSRKRVRRGLVTATCALRLCRSPVEARHSGHARGVTARGCAAPGEVASEELPEKHEGGAQRYADEKAKVEDVRNGHDATSGMAGAVVGLRVCGIAAPTVEESVRPARQRFECRTAGLDGTFAMGTGKTRGDCAGGRVSRESCRRRPGAGC